MSDKANKKTKNRIAVVVIHGMGEQNPMGTMSGLVKSLLAYEEIKGINCPGQNYFSAPADICESYEVQKWIVKEGNEIGNHKRPMTDFYELYWAPLMNDNKFAHVFPWMLKIIRTKKKDTSVKKLIGITALLILAVLLLPLLITLGLWDLINTLGNNFSNNGLQPKNIAIISIITYMTFAAVNGIGKDWMRYTLYTVLSLLFFYGVFVSFNFIFLDKGDNLNRDWIGGISLSISALLFKFTGDFLKKFLADASRYFEPNPTNIDNRERIRQLGVDLIEKITISDKYERIVILSHSLGSAVGYDIMRLYWAKHNKYYKLDKKARKLLKEHRVTFEKELWSQEIDKNYQKTQNEILTFLNKNYPFDPKNIYKGRLPWLISDFITLGSPLSKIKLFYANNNTEKEWEKIHERTIITNPPELDYHSKAVYYETKGDYYFHHGALFNFTRWTNIFHTKDLIGGEISKEIGSGTLNVLIDVEPIPKPNSENTSGLINTLFTRIKRRTPMMHSHYWANYVHRINDENHDHKVEGISPETVERMQKIVDKNKFCNDDAYTSVEKIYKAMHLYPQEILDEGKTDYARCYEELDRVDHNA